MDRISVPGSGFPSSIPVIIVSAYNLVLWICFGVIFSYIPVQIELLTPLAHCVQIQIPSSVAVAMRRSADDDLVSISPPLEFRDLDTSSNPATISVSSGSLVVPLPAPPQDFRDLTPSPGDPLLTFGLTPHTLPPIQSYHHGKTFIRKSVWDFADRVSLRIVSEAVVIATVLPEAGACRVIDFRKDGNLSTGSFEECVLSTSSSWEYLPPPGTARGGEQLQLEGIGRRCVSGDDIQFVVVKDETPRSSRHLGSDVHTKPMPLQCDIYSLPIDSIKPSGQIQSYLPLRLRSTNRQRPQEFKRHSLHILEGTPENAGGLRRGLGQESVERVCSFPLTHLSMDSNLGNGMSDTRGNWMLTRRRERNNNNENCGDKTLPNGAEIVRSQRTHGESVDPSNRKSSQNNVNEPGDGGKDMIGEKKKGRGLAFLNLFRKIRSREHKVFMNSNVLHKNQTQVPHTSFFTVSEFPLCRALPIPPILPEEKEEPSMGFRCVEVRLSPGDVPASLQEVKDCGWYWGPLASEGAEDLLQGEPDGSFIVRDSSDPRYIFSLTFKLNGLIRHVRIEHDHGNFSFGPLTRFKASTIVDFVEKAVAHSRSGRYLFFLHRRPVLGPMRVQLLHPYSRFRHPRSLQHMSRFVILKNVRRDLVDMLGLPKPLVDYLKAPQYYFEPPPPPNH